MNDSKNPIDLIAVAAEQFPQRPTWDQYFMATAMLLSTRSSCERLKVGCAIVTGGDRKNRLVAAGYNGHLPGSPHVSMMREGHEQSTVHAEQNAVTDCARRGVSCDKSTAYITHYPCVNCMKVLCAAGIRHIFYINDYGTCTNFQQYFKRLYWKFKKVFSGRD